jgi:hypothetical protein
MALLKKRCLWFPINKWFLLLDYQEDRKNYRPQNDTRLNKLKVLEKPLDKTCAICLDSPDFR